MGTLTAGLIAALLLFMAGRQIYKDRKNGKCSCGNSCTGCPGCCRRGDTGGCGGSKEKSNVS